MLVYHLGEALDTLLLHEVSPDIFTLMQDFFEAKWSEGKLTELFTDEDIHALLAVLSPYFGGVNKAQHRKTGPRAFPMIRGASKDGLLLCLQTKTL